MSFTFVALKKKDSTKKYSRDKIFDFLPYARGLYKIAS